MMVSSPDPPLSPSRSTRSSSRLVQQQRAKSNDDTTDPSLTTSPSTTSPSIQLSEDAQEVSDDATETSVEVQSREEDRGNAVVHETTTIDNSPHASNPPRTPPPPITPSPPTQQPDQSTQSNPDVRVPTPDHHRSSSPPSQSNKDVTENPISTLTENLPRPNSAEQDKRSDLSDAPITPSKHFKRLHLLV